MKVCVVGVGAIGGWIAGQLGLNLPPGEVELSALARGAALEALRSRGLLLHSAGACRQLPLRSARHAAELGPQDLVVLAVKTTALAEVVGEIAALIGPETRVLVAQNGLPWWFFDALNGPCQGLRLHSVDPGERLRQALPTSRVIGCVVHASCSLVAPAEVRHGMGQGLVLGEPAGGSSPTLTALTELLQRAGFAATSSELIQRDIWFKLWGNMTMNPISALTGATADRILDDPLVRAFVSAVMREAQAIGAAFGCPIDQQPEDRHAVTRRLGAFKTSMLQDREAGRPLEIDAIVSSVHEVGRHLGLATPHIDILAGLSRLMAPPPVTMP